MRWLVLVAFVVGSVVVTSAPASPPDGGSEIVRRWKCGDCECCKLRDGSVHSDCPGDPICACCE